MTLPHAPFGSTGHESSRIIFGAAALGGMSPARADATIEQVCAAGVNHFDTAASYGASEDRLHDYLQDHRSDVFLATKTGERSGSAARESLERSLERMGVDSVDMIQLHNLVEEEEWREAHGPGGAVEALFGACDEGLCRFVGVTGHGLRIPRMHVRSLAEAPFAAVLYPWNHNLATIDTYTSDVADLQARCRSGGIAMQTIKSIARRRWADPEKPHFSWYQPIEDPEPLRRAVDFVLATPDVFLNTTSDARLLDEVFRAASAFNGSAPDPDQLERDRRDLEIEPLFDGDRFEAVRP
jgi:aryl-alcohol dehydrogenase-like predicted oxidoreductase